MASHLNLKPTNSSVCSTSWRYCVEFLYRRNKTKGLRLFFGDCSRKQSKGLLVRKLNNVIYPKLRQADLAILRAISFFGSVVKQRSLLINQLLERILESSIVAVSHLSGVSKAPIFLIFFIKI
jgi:hypothetical protein